MKKSDFYYELPEKLIAQTPLADRTASRLMAIDRQTGEISHRHFSQLSELLRPGDLLVLNNSKVLPARLIGQIEGSERTGEFLLLKELAVGKWEIICKPGRHLKAGAKVSFGGGALVGTVMEVLESGNRVVEFIWASMESVPFYQMLDQLGEMPLPPYILEKLEDKNRYQTVYAKTLGSAAAPTAGLHFTENLMKDLTDKGVELAYVTLHVGLGTFRPVKEDDPLNHRMHSEFYILPEKTAEAIRRTKANNGRVIAVGTTSCRVLESCKDEISTAKDLSGWTDIFIYPGVKLNIIDGLITNFHLPESTLIMLVSAFLGREATLNAYKTAVDEEYRFFSFGDAMIIL